MKVVLVDIWCEDGATAALGPHEILYFNPARRLVGREFAGYLTADRTMTLYRASNPVLLAMLRDFRAAASGFGAEAMVVHQNPFPPEWLADHCADLTRVLGCFDDPHKTYSNTLPALWAFDGAYYCSPSYGRQTMFRDALERFGMPRTHWFALSQTVPTPQLVQAVEASWNGRAARALYVGMCYGDKVDKLARFNAGIGGRLSVHGKHWPLRGFGGFVAPLKGRRFFPKVVRPVSPAQRRDAYLHSLVGFNVHLSDGEETGNMRMYETPMHGAMLLCDRAGCDAHASIFEPDREAVYYADIEEAIDKCRFYFSHPAAALAIAQRGFRRAVADYDPRRVLLGLLDWTASLGARAWATHRGAAA